MKRQKRVLAIHDLSCLGKCSLYTAISVLTNFGLEVVSVPTCVLSTHTGGFQNYTFRDLSQDLAAIFQHFSSLKVQFDAVYAGYIGSVASISIINEFCQKLKREQNTYIFIDPAMADGGKLYRGFDDNYARKMAEFCKIADFLCPNVTESDFILQKKYQESYDEDCVTKMLFALSNLANNASVVITGLEPKVGKIGSFYYNGQSEKIGHYFTKKVPGYYHGSGDVFSAILLGNILNGVSLKRSVKRASLNTLKAIQFTNSEVNNDLIDNKYTKYGICFESLLR